MDPNIVTSERIQRALTVFRKACELAMHERGAYLAVACEGDAALRAEVESMLVWDDTESADEDGGSRPLRVALDSLIDEARTQDLPASIGGYRVVRLIAHGGMGVVYEAAQEHPARRVAIKLAHSGRASGERAKRFELEAQLLARLRHPGIAQIIQAGTTAADDGARPFFVMEFVEGRPLLEFAVAQAPTTTAKLELMIRVTEPIVFAHRHGVIHRDLKSDNILIGADGLPKVLDFGVAKVEAAGGFGAATLRTEAGRVIGTIGYMAPEQLGGETEALTAAADVYSLGVLTYELLTGRLPHELDAVTLSRALAVVTSTDAPLLGVVRPEYRGDLEAVVAKALEKDPRDRYADAAAFAADLERYLRDEPVLARRHSRLQRIRKFTRRNPALVTGLAATMMALLLGLVVALVFAAGEAEQRARFDRLGGVVQCARLNETATELYPPWPEHAARMHTWLADCDELLETRAEIRRMVAELVERAPSPTSAEMFLHGELTQLLADLDQLQITRVDIARRHRWASTIAEVSTRHPNARFSAAQARAAIAASERYAGQGIELSDRVLLGLVPIGANPQSGLWEFYHLRSAWDGTTDPRAISIPVHRADGSLNVEAETGIVFVLIPGGTFRMGAQKQDADRPNFDRDAEAQESPVHEVELSAYLLSKYEMTQGQWARLTSGSYPSHFQKEGAPIHGHARPIGDDRHPVEQVDWTECNALFARYGLVLPTEAQWEHGCRGGTSWPWFTGAERESLEGFANVLDATARRERPVLKRGEAFEDGFLGTAPVGTYRANPFGLHNVHGNVSEWVRDAPSAYDNETKPGDGLRPGPTRLPHFEARLARGGNHSAQASDARAAKRYDLPASSKGFVLGVRPAWRLGSRD